MATNERGEPSATFGVSSRKVAEGSLWPYLWPCEALASQGQVVSDSRSVPVPDGLDVALAACRASLSK
jgi:hypothetical protein